MEIQIPAQEVAAYSIILTYVVDFISELPQISKIATGIGKRIIATAVGIIYCILANVSIFSADTKGEVLTGLALAATAGLVVSKVADYAKAKKDIAVKVANGG